jgi:hypothetical protein
MRLAVLIVLLAASALSANDSQIDRRVRDAVTAMQEPATPGVGGSPVERATAALLADGGLEGHAAEIAQQFEQLFAALGRPNGYAEAGVRRYGQRAEIAYFVITCAKGVGFLRVVSVKGVDNSRVVGGILVGAHPEGIFPPALLDPEGIRPSGQ